MVNAEICRAYCQIVGGMDAEQSLQGSIHGVFGNMPGKFPPALTFV